MKDFLGNKLNVGDRVVFLEHCKTSSSLYKGTIKKLTNCFVFIDCSYGVNVKKDPCKCIKITGKEWIPIELGMPENIDVCEWYKSNEMDFTTVWATVENEYGYKHVIQLNRILIKMDTNTYKCIPEEKRKWEWSNSLNKDEKVIAWKPYKVPDVYE